GHHRRAALLDRGQRLLDRHPLLEHVVRLLDLPAAGALEVAGEQRLKLDQQRELVPPGQFLAHQVCTDPHALAQRHGHGDLTSLGRLKWMDSVVVTRSFTSTGPSPASAATIWPTTAGGADAPALMPTVETPASQPSSMSAGPSMRWAGTPTRSAVSTRRRELDEFAEPATSSRSDSAATARTACCRLVVA